MDSLTLGNSAPRGGIGLNWNAVSYGNASGSNDGHGAPDESALSCSNSSSCADTDARSAPTDAFGDPFALRADCFNWRNACGAGDGYDIALYVGCLYPCRTGDNRHGFHDNPDRWSSGSTIGRHDPAFDLRRTNSVANWQDHAAVLPNGHDWWLKSAGSSGETVGSFSAF